MDLKIASIFNIRFVLFSISIFYFLEKISRNKISLNSSFLKIYFLAILFIIIDSIIQFFFGTNLFGQQITNFRVSGVFGNEAILGSFLLHILPITFLLILYFNYNIKKNQIFLLIFFSLYFISIYISAGRTPFFLAILFLIMMILFEKNFQRILIKSLSILMVFMVCEASFEFGKSKLFHKMFFTTFIQFTDHYYHPRQNLTIDLTNKNDLKDDDKKHKSQDVLKEFLSSLKMFSDDHQNHYILAVELFKAKPIIGNGPKGFRNYCRNVEFNPSSGICSTHPHNYFFQILSELGLIGILFYLFGIFFLVFKTINLNIKAVKNVNCSSFYIVSIGLLILIFPIVPSGNFFNNWLSIVNYYYIGIYLYFYNQIHS